MDIAQNIVDVFNRGNSYGTLRFWMTFSLASLAAIGIIGYGIGWEKARKIILPQWKNNVNGLERKTGKTHLHLL